MFIARVLREVADVMDGLAALGEYGNRSPQYFEADQIVEAADVDSWSVTQSGAELISARIKHGKDEVSIEQIKPGADNYRVALNGIALSDREARAIANNAYIKLSRTETRRMLDHLTSRE